MESLQINELSIGDFLDTYRFSTIDFLPNLGNIGDMVIHASAIDLFKLYGININIINYLEDCTNEILFVSGGGNLIDNYSNLLNGLSQIINLYKEVCILPHTVYGEKAKKFFSNISANIKILCRERRTYQYLNSFIPQTVDLYLCEDLAFNFDVSGYSSHGLGILNAFRYDSEQTDIIIPPGNFDVSQDIRINDQTFIYNYWAMDNWSKFLQKFIDTIAGHKVINTNRLHVAIIGARLNKNVNLYPNSYFKNEAIYNFSLKKFPNVKWKGRAR